MTTVVRFPPALGDWVRQHLDNGVAPGELRGALQERNIAAEAAQAIVEAFVRARRGERAMPVDQVELSPQPMPTGMSTGTPTGMPMASALDGAPPYRYETPRFRPGSRSRRTTALCAWPRVRSDRCWRCSTASSAPMNARKSSPWREAVCGHRRSSIRARGATS
ncbi:hypothetical protein ACFJIX_17310 [Roseateles sp. UC29_93]|uniref:hypothetical protein n=1 Tax=Roseateles sp. UC29_93 TaxID=3350177 RepID=UPI00366D30D1